MSTAEEIQAAYDAQPRPSIVDIVGFWLCADDADIRKAALQTLAGVEPETIAEHAAAIAKALDDVHPAIREAAIETLGKQSKKDLSLYVAPLVAMIGDRNDDVRRAAVDVVTRLEPEMLTTQVSALVRWLDGATEEEEWRVRECAADVLVHLPPASLPSAEADAVARQLEDQDWFIRKAACDLLAKLEKPAALVLHAPAIARRLADAEEDVRMAALRALSLLEPQDLAEYASVVARQLSAEEARFFVRRAAAEALARLPLAVLGLHAAALTHSADEDAEESVRAAAEAALAGLSVSLNETSRTDSSSIPDEG